MQPLDLNKERQRVVSIFLEATVTERRAYEGLLKSQDYLDLYAKVTEAESALKSANGKCDVLVQHQKAYEVAINELSNVATEKAMLEAEGNGVEDEVQELYQQAKKAYMKAKQDYEKLRVEAVSEKDAAEQELKIARDALSDFVCAHEEDLIAEKTELESELKEARKKDGGYSIIKAINNDLYQVKKALSIICDKAYHIYEKVAFDGDCETFRCKRCGHEYHHRLPAMWADK